MHTVPAKPGISCALQAMADFCNRPDLTARQLMIFLFVASRGPVLLSQLNAQSSLTHANLDETVGSLAQREQNGQSAAVLTIFSATDRSDKWIAPTTRGRELFNLIQQNAYALRMAA